MELPKIDLKNLPDQTQMTGVFGSAMEPSRMDGSNDSILLLMVFIYDLF
ncbi:MAG: hypothetical protein KGN34_00030 [Sphingomonadales bacterium]|nr:hypothetical protein [Sphingomonadales bacterium]